MGVPKRVCRRITTLRECCLLTGVIQPGILRWEESCGGSTDSLCVHRHHSGSRRGVGAVLEAGNCALKMGQGTLAKISRKPLEAKKEKDKSKEMESSPGTTRRIQPCQHLGFGLWTLSQIFQFY